MSLATPVPEDHPLKIAWEKYRLTPEFANTRNWATHTEHTEGSLWAAFSAGFDAAKVLPTGEVKVRLVEWSGDGPTTPMGGFNLLILRPWEIYPQVQTGPHFNTMDDRKVHLEMMRKAGKDMAAFHNTALVEDLVKHE